MENILIKQAKKYDDSYVCKVEYNADKFHVKIPECRVVRIKPLGVRAVYIYIKVPKTTLDGVLALEDHFVEEAKTHSKKWFSHRIKESTIEEYFQTSVAVDRVHGQVLRIKIDNPNHELDSEAFDPSSRYSVILRLHSIKFLKQSFFVSWDVKDFETTGSNASTRNWIEDDDEPNAELDGTANDDDDDDMLAPTEEIREELIYKIAQRIKALNKDINTQLAAIASLENDLSALYANPISLELMEEVALRVADVV